MPYLESVFHISIGNASLSHNCKDNGGHFFLEEDKPENIVCIFIGNVDFLCFIKYKRDTHFTVHILGA